MLNLLFTKTPLYFFIQSLWRDEAFSYFMAKQSLFSIIKTTVQDFNPPLYYFFLHFWIKIFGKGEISLRSLSLSFFAINIYVVFLFLRDILKVKGKRIPVYLLIFSFNPFLVYYAFEARMYSLLALLATLSFYYYLKKEKYRYLVFTSLGLYSHYFFLLVVFTQLITYFVLKKKRRKAKEIKTVLIPLICFLPWAVYILPNLITRSAVFWIKPPKVIDLFSSFGIIFTGYERLYKFYNLPIFLVSMFFLLIILGFFNKLKKRNKPLFTLLVLWSFFPYFLIFLVSFLKPIFLPRYLIFTSVGFNLLLFYLLENTKKKWRWFFIAVIFFVIVHYTGLEVVHKRKSNIRRTISEIRKLATKDDYLFVSGANAASYFVAAYYFDESRVYIFKETANKIPYYIGKVLLPLNKITYKLPPYPKKAFILDDDYHYRIQAAL